MNLSESKQRTIKTNMDDPMDNDLLSSEFQISAAAAQVILIIIILSNILKGGRKYMEDRINIEVGRDASGRLDYIFAAIYDGHGGPQASEYACRNLLDNITGNQAFFSDDDQQVLGAIRDGFLQTHYDMEKTAKMWPPTVSGFPCTAGTTATCAFIRNGKLYTGHVGDSSIILANFAEAAAGFNDAKLTEDHKPEKHSERLRIEKAGGGVASKSGVLRVIWKRPIRGHRGPVRRSTGTESIPFLAVARSLGDFWSLNPDNNQFVVSPEPDVDVFRLKSTDNFVVLCSDGLSNVVGFRSIVQILQDIDKQNENRPNSINYSHYLMQNALKKWRDLRADNISIICIKLNADKIPYDHPCIMETGLDINVCEQLTEHPFAMFHISSENTFRLKDDNVHHFFSGILDKYPRKSNQVAFSGPGFVVPEIISDNFNALETVSGASICMSELGQNGHDYGDSSDVEEAKQFTSEKKNSEKELLNEEPPEDVEISQEVQKKAFTPSNFEAKKKEVKGYDGNVGKSILSTSRVGIKRRRTENGDSDDFIRNSSNLFPNSSFKKRVYFEEQQDEDMDDQTSINPPPAKRSRLQSVLNFFSKFLKW